MTEKTPPDFMMSLTAQVKRHAGLSLTPYRSSQNELLIGYGHRLGQPISMEAAQWILQDDLQEAFVALDKYKPFWRMRPAPEKVVMGNLCVQMGWVRLGSREFADFWAAMEAGEYHKAGSALRETVWYTEVGGRGEELVAMLEGTMGT